MIFRLEIILSVVAYERENNIWYEKNLKLMKSNSFKDIFCNRIVFLLSLLTNLLKMIGFFKITIFEDFLVIFKIGKYRIRENTFSKRIRYDL